MPNTAQTLNQPTRFAVLGNPIAHSLSPQIQERFAQLCGKQMTYERILVATDAQAHDGWDASLHRLAREGYLGCNVTVPFKGQAFASAAQFSARAQQANTCNTLCFTPNGIYGDNTDGIGLLSDVESNLGFSVENKRILLLGAGGAAAGALGPLLQANPAGVDIANRNVDKAQALRVHHANLAREHGVELKALSLAELGQPESKRAPFDLIINATASSLSGAQLKLADDLLSVDSALVYDMMYGAAAQSFLQWGACQHAQTSDGLGMLVEQAAHAFYLWHGIRPPSRQVLTELRQSCS